MIPDYTSSPESIFNEYALHTIGEVTNLSAHQEQGSRVPVSSKEVRKALILLSCAGLPNQSLDLPSWTPDWSAALLYRPFVFDSRFCAGGDAIELDWDHESGCLQLTGKLVDTIAFSGKVRLGHETASDLHTANATIERWWLESNRLASTRVVRSPGSTMNVDAFDCLRRDLFLCGEYPSAWSDLATSNSVKEHGYFKGEQNDTISPTTGQFRQRRRGSLLDELDHSTANAYHDAQQTLTLGPTRGRVMVVTTTGYLGLAPYGTQEGDLVYVILGYGVPSVLRPRPDGAFTLVGEAYVQGIMNGEFLEMDQLASVEDIFIR